MLITHIPDIWERGLLYIIIYNIYQILVLTSSIILLISAYKIRKNQLNAARKLILTSAILGWLSWFFYSIDYEFDLYSWIAKELLSGSILGFSLPQTIIALFGYSSDRTSSQTDVIETGNLSKFTIDTSKYPELQPIHLHLNRLIQSQPKPLEVLDDFYSFLELKGFKLTPELKGKIRQNIQDILEEKRKFEKTNYLEVKLFSSTTAPTNAAQSVLPVIPQPTVSAGSKCQVCLTEFSTAEPGAVKCPHCGSLFHYRCVAKWVNKHRVCPSCKKEVSV